VTARDRDGRENVDIWTLPLDKCEVQRLLDGMALAVGLHSRVEEVVPTKCSNAIGANADSEEIRMDSNYVFLCGVMWCRFGRHDAGKELLRAADAEDPDMKALAWAMFAKGVRRLRELEKPAQPVPATSLGGELCG
jgi:hypothetical protein